MTKYLMSLLTALCFVSSANATVISDFSWIPTDAVNTASTILSDGTELTLEVENVPFDNYNSSSARIYSAVDGASAIITLTFSRTIESLRLLIGDIDVSVAEHLNGFSKSPDSVDGNLLYNSGVIYAQDENVDGNLFWANLYDNSISFTFNRVVRSGMFLHEIEIDSAPVSVPLPATLWLFMTGLFGFTLYRKKYCK